MSLTKTDSEKIKEIEETHKASQFTSATLHRLLKKANNSSYAFDRIITELLKRGEIK